MSNEYDENELMDFVFGSQIGFGVHRKVYDFIPNKDYVIKVAKDDDGRAVNLMEARIFNEIRYTPAEKWFAPVIEVSGRGKYLLQRKIESLPKDQYPEEIPAFFTDTKYQNFGYLKEAGKKGRFVCCDFGSFNIFQGITTKMKKAKWWDCGY